MQNIRKLPNPQEPKPVGTISDKLISTAGSRLVQGKQVGYSLPRGGRLHIEGALPFLIVYRRPANRKDPGTERLVKGEASYLIAAGDQILAPSLTALVTNIVETVTAQCKAFLIVEVWSVFEDSENGNLRPLLPPPPGFRIFTSQKRPPTATIEVLQKALKRIKFPEGNAAVAVTHQERRWPHNMPALIQPAVARELNCFTIGLEISPAFRDPASGELYPAVLRTLHRGLTRALKRAFFEFTHSQTNHRSANYLALGRRAFVKAVWNVDRQLAEISESFSFLLQVTPVNIEQSLVEFLQRGGEHAPKFFYRPLPIDVGLLKRKLYNIAIERVDDPTLDFLFRQNRIEIDRQLALLRDRGKKEFLYGSLQLFGAVSGELLGLAKATLEMLPSRNHEDAGGGDGQLDAVAFAERAMHEVDYYRRQYPGVTATVQVRDDTVGLMVARGNLLIGQQFQVPAARVAALLSHEVGTHIVTYFNGLAQPLKQLHTGLAGYDELQEGLAVLSEYLAGGLSRSRLRLLAGRVVAAHCMIGGATFVDTFRELNRAYDFDERTAFIMTARLFRGGGLTKDAVYLRGLVKLLKYLGKGGELEPLLVGKIAAEHVPIIRELQWRGLLRPVPLRPRYLDYPGVAEKLARLHNGMSAIDLVTGA